MRKDLKIAVENLTLHEKEELMEYLSDRIKKARMGRTPLRCSILLGEMADALGWERPIPLEGRDSHHVWARTMVAYQMSKEGYTTTEIGRQMMKDHSTIVHLRNKMRDAFDFPRMYGDVLEMWDKFQKRIQDDIHEGTTENPVSLGGELPDCGQCAMGEESGEIRTPGDL